MEENSAPVERDEPAPVFAAYRRGYDPDQVDHYVAEQSHRLEAAEHRADEAERKLGSAVQQLREMHRRVTALEAIGESVASGQPVQTVPIDTLGAHVQRILSEAWEGSQALRNEAVQEAAETKELALAEGDRIVASARRKAESVGEELARRRQAYLEKLESERARAVAQMTFLQEQREIAISDLHRVKTLVDSTIADVTLVTPPTKSRTEALSANEATAPTPEAPRVTQTPAVRATAPVGGVEHVSAATMPVHRIPAAERPELPDPSELVRSHRAHEDGVPEPSTNIRTLPRRGEASATRPSVFDFDEHKDQER